MQKGLDKHLNAFVADKYRELHAEVAAAKEQEERE